MKYYNIRLIEHLNIAHPIKLARRIVRFAVNGISLPHRRN